MVVTDATIVEAMEAHYRNTTGYDITSEFSVDKFFRVRRILNALDGHGISDLEVMRIALKAFENQVIKQS